MGGILALKTSYSIPYIIYYFHYIVTERKSGVQTKAILLFL